MADSTATDAASIAKAAKAAFEASQLIPSSERVQALREIAKELESSKAQILDANRKDLAVRPPLFLLPLLSLHIFALTPYA